MKFSSSADTLWKGRKFWCGVIAKGIWCPEIADITQGSFVTTCQFSTKNCNRPAMGKWSPSLEKKKRPNYSKTTLLLERLSSLLLVTYLYLTGFQLLLDFGVKHSSDLVEQPGTFPCSSPSPWNMSFSLLLGSLGGDLTVCQKIDPLTWPESGGGPSPKKCMVDFPWAASERIFTVSFLFFTFSSRDGPNRFFFPALGMAQKLRS